MYIENVDNYYRIFFANTCETGRLRIDVDWPTSFYDELLDTTNADAQDRCRNYRRRGDSRCRFWLDRSGEEGDKLALEFPAELGYAITRVRFQHRN